MALGLRLLLISLAWVVIEIGSGYLTNRLPLRLFEADGPLTRTRRWEREGQIYAGVLRVHRWKDALPEAGAMFSGGFAKRSLRDRSPRHLDRFIAETRRAELTHWLPVLFSLTFFAWNPFHVAVWMPIVGLLANAPFIVVQRYLRPRLARLLDASRRTRRSTRQDA
ncbi:MAG: hypothetical protein ACLFP4_11015 [Spirochaetales bacterium]